MIWLAVLFVVLQPGIFSRKKAPVNISDILVRAVVFGVAVYFLTRQKLDGFQGAPTMPQIPVCQAPNGIFVIYSGASNQPSVGCLPVNTASAPVPGGRLQAVLAYRSGQQIQIKDPNGAITYPMVITAAEWVRSLGESSRNYYPASLIGIDNTTYPNIIFGLDASGADGVVSSFTSMAKLNMDQQNKLRSFITIIKPGSQLILVNSGGSGGSTGGSGGSMGGTGPSGPLVTGNVGPGITIGITGDQSAINNFYSQISRLLCSLSSAIGGSQICATR
jgi:hypothetical protein